MTLTSQPPTEVEDWLRIEENPVRLPRQGPHYWGTGYSELPAGRTVSLH